MCVYIVMYIHTCTVYTHAYPLVNHNIYRYRKVTLFLIGKSTINGHFSRLFESSRVNFASVEVCLHRPQSC